MASRIIVAFVVLQLAIADKGSDDKHSSDKSPSKKVAAAPAVPPRAVPAAQSAGTASPAVPSAGSASPCAVQTCGKDFKGTCKPGQNRAHPLKECPSGLCSEAACCVPKPCDKTQTDALCKGQWIPRVFKAAVDYQFSKLSDRNCEIGWSKVRSEAACTQAASKLKVPFVKSISSPRYPNGCFQCSSQAECAALTQGMSPSQFDGLFWNNNPQSTSKGVSEVRHIGTRIPCQKDPPGCNPAGCDAQTCCIPLTCGANFGETCLAGESPKPASTICNKGGLNAATSCSRTDCCTPKTCATSDLKTICANGWVVNQKASSTVCPENGCNEHTCCRQELCGTDFPGKCSAGENLLATVPCPVGGCNKDVCCQRKTCATYSCKTECSQNWIAKKGTLFCKETGCDENTCCEVKSCGLDFKSKCAPGQLAADPHTQCNGAICTTNDCCVGKLCADSFSCSAHGLPLGLKPRPVGTMCKPSGCSADTCCVTATCGTDFPQGGCGPWALPKPSETVCNSGKCDQQTCCAKRECIITQATCNTGKINGVKAFSVYNTQFPNANHNTADAEGACSALDRSDCFATLDENCDGQSLRRCIPNHANDPSSIVLRPSTKSCVCYRKEEPTCGYNMPEGVFCGKGEKVDFYAPCGGTSGKLCDKKTCCHPLTCGDSYQCKVGERMVSADSVCPKDGCDSLTCCAPLTCSADFQQGCPAGTEAVDGSTACSAGACTIDTCCSAVAHTTPPPKQTVCLTDYRGSCGANEEFLPQNICQGASFVLAPKDTNQCPNGFVRITDLAQCVAGTAALASKLQLNGEDGKPMSTDEASLTSEIQKRTIGAGNRMGQHKPYGCYFDSQNQALNGKQMKINNVWLNLDQAVASKHDNSALICVSSQACSRETCCQDVGATVTCDSFNGCKDPMGLVPRDGHIMCAKDGCDTTACCRPKTCGDFFSAAATTGACGAHQNRLDHSITCNGPCSQSICCKDQPTTTLPPNPCTTVYVPQSVPHQPAVPTSAPTSPPPSCGHKFAKGAKDTTACPSGFVPIETVDACTEAAQFLSIQPSDTNGDGKTVDVKDKNAFRNFIKQREIKADDPLGIHKPHGCFVDESVRILKGKQAIVTTIWLNHRAAGTGKHDNSSPICQEDCSAIMKKFDVVSDSRQGDAGTQNSNLPALSIAALSFGGLLAMVTFVRRRRTTSSRGGFYRSVVLEDHESELEPLD